MQPIPLSAFQAIRGKKVCIAQGLAIGGEVSLAFFREKNIRKLRPIGITQFLIADIAVASLCGFVLGCQFISGEVFHSHSENVTAFDVGFAGNELLCGYVICLEVSHWDKVVLGHPFARRA